MATQHQLLNREEKQSISNCFSLGENTQNSFQKRVKCFQERKNSFLKTISQIGFLIIMCLMPLLSVSQEIKWAKGFNGKSQIPESNNIISSVFDKYGNLYISARAGNQGTIDNSDIFEITSNNFGGIFIAKIDNNGTFLWKKSIMSMNNNTANARLQLINDSVLVVLTQVFPPNQSKEDKMQFLDTIISGNYTECTFPFPTNKWGHDALLELDTEDGHLITVNYFHMLYHGTTDIKKPLQQFYYDALPFFIDKDRNLFLFIDVRFGSPDDHSLDIIINDKDTLSFVEDTCLALKVIKLSPNLELIWAKNIIKSVESNVVDKPFFATFTYSNLAFDSNDNIYLTGTIVYSSQMNNESFKGSVDFGNNKKILLNRLTNNVGCIIKYDTSGTAQWVNQIYIDNYTEKNPPYLPSIFFKPTIKDDYVYVPYRIRGVTENQHILYFDSLFTIPMDYTNMQGLGWEHSGFIKYDKNAGGYLSHGLIKGYSDEFSSVAINNGQIYGQVSHNNSWDIGGLDTVITSETSNAVSLVRWTTDGELIDVIANYENGSRGGNITKNPNNPTEIFFAGRFNSDTLNLQDTILIQQKLGDDNAYMFVLKDSSFLNHYTVIRDTICDSVDWKGNHITWKGDYYDTLQAADGYDSIIIYRVQVRHSFKEETSVEINEDETYDFHGQILYSAGTFYDSLQTINGCDSVYILNLSVKSGLEDITDGSNNKNRIKIIPNPAKDIVTIEAYGDVSIINGKGQVVRIIKDVNGKKVLNIADLEEGVYYLQIGNSSEKFIKQ